MHVYFKLNKFFLKLHFDMLTINLIFIYLRFDQKVLMEITIIILFLNFFYNF